MFVFNSSYIRRAYALYLVTAKSQRMTAGRGHLDFFKLESYLDLGSFHGIEKVDSDSILRERESTLQW